MKYDPDNHHRRSIRLKGYDYTSAGMYFITICTYQRECLFGEIVDGEMQLNELGQVVAGVYLWLATQYSYVHLNAWIVMPNHLHGILVLTDDPRRGVSRNAPTEDATTRKSLGRLVGAFKTVSTKRINLIRDTSGSVVWQRNYYEHIIRNEKSLHDIRRYVHHNPISWQQDQLRPDNPSR
ncbi:transposase [Oculatella sp. FACHB-28]|uniref:transposase n=1 Tax=Oculatella sp. FACHB-28 TaxID=2692845 RepID=UPI0016827D19|nr:transposase [Oculatella sp. FACHB-28]